jgi:malate dehydrogenase (oxaloacetate-decarboxylating)
MTYHIEKDGEKLYIRTKLKGKALMFYPILNKGSAFTEQERDVFGLAGRLPPTVETLEQQVKRAYCQYQSFTTDEAKSIYLHALYTTAMKSFFINS